MGAFYGLREEDVIAAHYHDPFIAYYMRGADTARLVGQALARENGYARGRALGFTGPVRQNASPGSPETWGRAWAWPPGGPGAAVRRVRPGGGVHLRRRDEQPGGLP